MKCIYSLKTDIGKRTEQQDYAYVGQINDIVFAIVCDGMGGKDGGSIASKTAVQLFVESAKEKPIENIPEFFLRTVEKVNDAVCSLTNNSGIRLNAGTTLTSIIVQKESLYWLSIGDSRLFIFRDGICKQITNDHNYKFILDSQLKKGEITKEFYNLNIHKGSALISYIGLNQLKTIDINFNPFVLKENDVIVLCSDGLYKALSDQEMSRIINHNTEIELITDEIFTKAYNNMIDNTTFIVLKMVGDV